jgi:hypothetical protein
MTEDCLYFPASTTTEKVKLHATSRHKAVKHKVVKLPLSSSVPEWPLVVGLLAQGTAVNAYQSLGAEGLSPNLGLSVCDR